MNSGFSTDEFKKNFNNIFKNKKLKKYEGEGCAVYALFYNDILIYIGSTKQLGARISAHRENKKFDTIIFHTTSTIQEAKQMEKSLISIFVPEYNRRDNPQYVYCSKNENKESSKPKKWLTTGEAAREINVSQSFIIRACRNQLIPHKYFGGRRKIEKTIIDEIKKSGIIKGRSTRCE